MLHGRTHRLAGFNRPQLRSASLIALFREDGFSVRAEGYENNAVQTEDRLSHGFTRLYGPKPHGAFFTRNHEAVAVGMDRHRPNSRVVPNGRSGFLPCVRRPEMHQPIDASEHPLAIGGKYCLSRWQLVNHRDVPLLDGGKAP